MKTITIPFEHRYLSDVKRIQRVLAENDYVASLRDCAFIWDEYSDSMAAGWIMLPDSDEELMDELRADAEEYSTGEA